MRNLSQLLLNIQPGSLPAPMQLRAAASLPNRAWVDVDAVVAEAARLRAPGVGHLYAAGLTYPLGGMDRALGTLTVEWDEGTDLSPATVTMDAAAQFPWDRQGFNLKSVPMPLIGKEFRMSIRELMAAQNHGRPFDTTNAGIAGKVVGEGIESLLMVGSTWTYSGAQIYGYTTHPSRNTGTFEATGAAWDSAGKTGAQILADCLSMITALRGDRKYGPYRFYVCSDYAGVLDSDFKANSDRTVRERIMAIEGVEGIDVSDALADDDVICVQLSRDTVDIVDGFQPVTIPWEERGGLVENMVVLASQAPRVKADGDGRSGVAHFRPA